MSVERCYSGLQIDNDNDEIETEESEEGVMA